MGLQAILEQLPVLHRQREMLRIELTQVRPITRAVCSAQQSERLFLDCVSIHQIRDQLLIDHARRRQGLGSLSRHFTLRDYPRRLGSKRSGAAGAH